MNEQVNEQRKERGALINLHRDANMTIVAMFAGLAQLFWSAATVWEADKSGDCVRFAR